MDLLSVDSDYISAIYMHFPKSIQEKWDDYDQEPFKDEWQAFKFFLDEQYKVAIKKRVRMESIAQFSGKFLPCKKCRLTTHTDGSCATKSTVVAGAVETTTKVNTKDKQAVGDGG